MTLDQLMDQRHQAYKAAFAKGFQNTELTEAWRAANQPTKPTPKSATTWRVRNPWTATKIFT